MSLLDCWGQDQAILRLQRARRSGRVPHGYIFHGPDGVGKGMLARAWAKLQLCSEPRQIGWPQQRAQPPTAVDIEEIDDYCGVCDDCRMVEAQAHPDLHIIEKELAKYTDKRRERQLIDLPIDVVREFVIKPAGVRPARGRGRIFIIEEAQSMNRAAQNALLKTLEEPPARTFLILITSQPGQFLPTIRSRCQMIRFGGLPREFIFGKLREAAVEPAQAGYWCDFCEGRLAAALLLTRMDIYEAKCQLVEALAQLDHTQALSLAAEVLELTKQFGQRYAKERPGYSSSDALRRGQLHWLDVMAHSYNLALRWAVAGQNQSVSLDQPVPLERIARRYGAEGCAEAIRATYRARSGLLANVNPSLIFDCLMLEYLRWL